VTKKYFAGLYIYRQLAELALQNLSISYPLYTALLSDSR